MASRNPNLDTTSTPAHTIPQGKKLSPWYSGLSPKECPGFQTDGTLKSLAQPNLESCTRQQVLDYFNNTWTLTELLFSALTFEECYFIPPYHGLRHPFIFYFAHPAALYANKLRVAKLLKEPVNPYFESLFETGVDEMSWDDMSKNEMEWPPLAEVRLYRNKIYHLISELIRTHPGLESGHKTICQQDPLWALFLAFEHERIHLETSSVLIREFPATLLQTPKEWPKLQSSPSRLRGPTPEGDHPKNSMLTIPGRDVVLGKPNSYPTFGWDNEYGSRKVSVPATTVSKFMISNAEYYEFVSTGAYSNENYWSEEGWQWRKYRNAKWPSFWVLDGPQGAHKYQLRTTFEIIPMPWDWPVVVNFHEANAYAKWKSAQENKSYRLITEAEFKLIQNNDNCNASLKFGAECSVDSFSKDDIFDTSGNLWHWCEDHFHPLDGFKIHPYYDDFSTPCFDGKHNMILGGSFISTGDEASTWARFHFRPHFFQHAGFRLVEGKALTAVLLETTMTQTQEAKQLAQAQAYLQFMTPYSSELAKIIRSNAPSSTQRFLEIGCGIGGVSRELNFSTTIAVDNRIECMELAKSLDKTANITLKVEGNISETIALKVTNNCKNIEFRQVDYGSLPAEYKEFDCVFLHDIIANMANPRSLLARLAGARGLVKKGGTLIIADSFDWNESITPIEAWLGGTPEFGPSEKALFDELAPDFQILQKTTVNRVLQKDSRSSLHSQLMVAAWTRK